MRRSELLRTFLALIAVVVWAAAPMQVFALAKVTDDKILQNSELNDNATCSSATAGSNAPNSAGSGEDLIHDFLISMGLSPVQAAGALGNIDQESGFSPTAGTESGDNPYGIVQWLNGGGSTRKSSLRSFAGDKFSDLQTQLNFMKQELEGDYKTAFDHMKAATTLAEATTIWQNEYEGAAGQANSERLQKAQTAKTKYGDSTEPAATPASPGAPAAGDGDIDSQISDIVDKYHLQSAEIKKLDGDVIGGVRQNEYPITPASTMKLIIGDVVLQEGMNLDANVTVTSDTYYNHLTPDITGTSFTVRELIQHMLAESSNEAANMLVKHMGGVSSFSAKAHSHGYDRTTMGGYYHNDSGHVNKSTIAEQIDAMNHIFTTSGGGYDIAQAALTPGKNYYNVADIANKAGWTQEVASNVGLFQSGSDKYIVGLYREGNSSDDDVKSSIAKASLELAQLVGSTNVGNTADAATQCCSTVGGISGDAVTKFLQALSEQESGGDPTQPGSAGGARGKYQYIDSTWHSSATTYYPPADTYATANVAPEEVQDAVAYIEYSVKFKQFNNDLFKLAVSHFYPVANEDPSKLDVVPPSNVITPREYANALIQKVEDGAGSSIEIKPQNAPDFDRYLQAALSGAAAPAAGTPNTDCTGVGADSHNIVATALSLSWPDDSHGTTPKPEYQQAYDQYNSGGAGVADCGSFVATVMRASGADPNYPPSGTAAQADYVMHSDKYEVVPSVSSTADLQPGDIMIVNQGDGQGANGHTYIYVGDQGGGKDEASASLNTRAANLGKADVSDARGNYMRARLK